MLWKCSACTCLYAPGLDRCPQCGSAGHVEVDSGGEPLRSDTPTPPDPPTGPAVPAKTAAGKAGGGA